jgi:tetratricopeptide (TPR) repeat protein
MNNRLTCILRVVSCFLLCLCLFVSCKTKEKSSLSSNSEQAKNLKPEADKKFYDACKEKVKGNLELAVNGFNECLRLDPGMAAAHFELAGIYNLQERSDLSLAHAKEAAQSDPKNEWYHLLYAQILQEAHKPAEAAAEFRKLILLSPDKLEYYYGYSDALLYEGKYKEAIKVYEEIEQKMGPSEEVTLQKAKVLERAGEPEKAEEEIRKLIKDSPLETRYYMALAQLLQERSNNYHLKGNKTKMEETNEKVHQLFLDLLRKDPSNPFALLSLGEYYEFKEQPDSALLRYKEAMANPDLDVDSKFKIAMKYFYQSETDAKLKPACEELCRTFVLINPTESKAHDLLANFLYREKRLAEARTEYRKSVDIDRSKYVSWNQLLILDSELNDFTDMLNDSREAMELFPSLPLPFFFNGLALVQSRKYAEAIDVLNNGLIFVMDNKPLESQFLSTLGDVYYKTKEYKKSDDSYDKALALDPDNSYVLNNYSYYLSLRNENLDKAEKMARRANELDPKNANFQDTFAWVLYKTAKYDQALEWMDKVFLSNPDPSAVMLEHYGDILYKLNRKEEAFAFWMKAKLKGGGSELLEKKLAEKKLYE